MNPEHISKQIIAWLQNEVNKAHAKGLAFGLSGGIDSALVAALAKKAFPQQCIGVIMPCHSQEQDKLDAIFTAEKLNFPYIEIELSASYDSLINAIQKGTDMIPQGLAASNIKPRLRMSALYSVAAERNYLVAGTSNKSEAYIGYYTKYGDGGSDLWPIVGLVKSQVWELAQYLGVPDKIINKAPSAGLWPGQTDEQEMGLTYSEIDEYLLTGKGTKEVIKKIEDMHSKSQHKRKLPAQPQLDLD